MPARLRRAQDEYGELGGIAWPGAAAGSADAANSRGSLRFSLTVEEAVHDADLAIDFVPDELESKLEIFSLLDRMSPPRTILCTPTQTLSLTDLASCTYRPGLCVGLSGSADNLLQGQIAILRSRFAQESALAAVQGLLRRIGIDAEIMWDREQPTLVKNLTRQQG